MASWIEANLPVEDVGAADELGGLNVVWRADAVPEQWLDNPTLFDTLGFPPLRDAKSVQRYELLPPV